MQKHIKRVVAGGSATVVLAVGLLVTDIPKALEQADKSFAFIAKSLVSSHPNEHFVTEAWGHPWAVIVLFMLAATLGVFFLWGAEAFWVKPRRRVAPVLVKPETDHLSVQLIPDGIDGDHLHFRFSLTNRGARPLEILEDHMSIPNFMFGLNGSLGPRILPPAGSLDIVAMPINDLMIYKSVRLNVLYRVEGDTEEKAFYYGFVLPTSLRIGVPLNPSNHGSNTDHVERDINDTLRRVFAPFAQPVTDESVTSHGQTGGITARNVNIGIREPNALYQDNKKVATVFNGSFTSDRQNEILFQQVAFNDSVDTSRPVDFQGAKLMCRIPRIVRTAIHFTDLHENVKCLVVK